MAADPFVSVVTPVYNGEKYLRQCIESVLGQTYTHWEYTIVNNRSTDGSLAVAEEYARRDNRIRVQTNDKFLGVSENHNVAFNLISDGSKYCKLVHADDWLFPECIARLVEVAEAHPSVGLVGSYTLQGAEVGGSGLPHPSTMVPGRALCRLVLREDAANLVWSPSCVLIRSDIIRASGGAFYKGPHLYADDEACYEVLQRWDFGFVHQVLTFVRIHGESVSALRADRLNSYLPAHLAMLTRYGPACLSDGEYRYLLRRKFREYYRFLAHSVFRWEDREFWEFHSGMLATLGHPFNRARLAGWTIIEGVEILLRQARACAKALMLLGEQRGPNSA